MRINYICKEMRETQFHMSQTEFAKKHKLPQQTVSRYEAGLTVSFNVFLAYYREAMEHNLEDRLNVSLYAESKGR